MANHPIVDEIDQSGPKWGSDITISMLLAQMKQSWKAANDCTQLLILFAFVRQNYVYETKSLAMSRETWKNGHLIMADGDEK